MSSGSSLPSGVGISWVSRMTAEPASRFVQRDVVAALQQVGRGQAGHACPDDRRQGTIGPLAAPWRELMAGCMLVVPRRYRLVEIKTKLH